MKYIRNILVALLLHLVAVQLSNAQIIYRIIPSEAIAAKLSGTSTLHDWSMAAKDVEGNAEFVVVEKKLQRVVKLSFILPVENLKSNDKIMDNNAYKALKSDEFKNLDFVLTSATVGPPQSNQYPVKALGNLTIAGVTKQISMDVFCEVKDDKTIVCKGGDKLKMTDYNVKPPTFLFGEMKTGDELIIDFNILFKN